MECWRISHHQRHSLRVKSHACVQLNKILSISKLSYADYVLSCRTPVAERGVLCVWYHFVYWILSLCNPKSISSLSTFLTNFLITRQFSACGLIWQTSSKNITAWSCQVSKFRLSMTKTSFSAQLLRHLSDWWLNHVAQQVHIIVLIIVIVTSVWCSHKC